MSAADMPCARAKGAGSMHAADQGTALRNCTESRNDVQSRLAHHAALLTPEATESASRPSLTRRHVALGASSMLLAAGMPPSLSLMTLMQVQQSSCQCSCAQKRQWPKECLQHFACHRWCKRATACTGCEGRPASRWLNRDGIRV